MTASTTPGWVGRAFLDAGGLLYVGPGASAVQHSHHAVQLVMARTGTIAVTLDGTPGQYRAVLIPARAPHSLDAAGAQIALLLLDSHGARGRTLDRRARSHQDLGTALDAVGFPDGSITADDATRWCDAVVGALGDARTRSPLSSVVRRTISFIEENLDGTPRLASAAALVDVSATRLTHRFSQEVGIPFRRFVLWSRIKRAVDVASTGADLTEAALGAGFSDSAHLSRTFRAMFGLSPSSFLPHIEIAGRMHDRSS